MSDWEDTFKSWGRAPSATEGAKAERAETAIRKAIESDPKLSQMDITVFTQGSYRNKTNVRQNSDVDVCVRLNSTFFAEYPPGTTQETFGNMSGAVTFRDYKLWVGQALEHYFGKDVVKRGDKAFNIKENTYRVDSDVVPTLEHRRYVVRVDGSHYHLSGIEFYADSGRRIINWPEQNYENGLSKHEATGRRYRKVVRILKRLRDTPQTDGIAAAKDIASCLIEALVWNVPNHGFNHESYSADVRFVIANAFNNTRTDADNSDWGEVNELKYLFRPGQPWTRAQANMFLDAAWNRIGFE